MPVRTSAWSSTRNTRIVIVSPLQPLCRWTSAWANRRKRHRKPAHHATKPGPSDFSDAATGGNPTPTRAVVPQTRPGIRRILSWLATRTPRPTDGPCGCGGVATDAAPPALHRGTDSRMRNPATPRPTRAWLHRRNPSAVRRRGPAFNLPHTGLPRQAGFCALRHGWRAVAAREILSNSSIHVGLNWATGTGTQAFSPF